MDIADLLGDNSSTYKNRTKKGDFLGLLQKNKNSSIPESKNYANSISVIDESDETKSQYKGIEVDNEIDTFNKDKDLSKNLGDDRTHARSDSAFYPPRNYDRKSQSNYGYNIEKTDDSKSFENLLNRRKTNTLSNIQQNDNPKFEEPAMNYKESIIDSSFNKRGHSSIITGNEQQEDDLSGVYVPSISKNSRRSRIGATSSFNNLQEAASRGNSQDKKEEPIMSFKDRADKEDQSNQSKNLLKSAKSYSINNVDNKNYTNENSEPDLFSNDFTKRNTFGDKSGTVNKTLNKMESALSFGGPDNDYFKENIKETYSNNYKIKTHESEVKENKIISETEGFDSHFNTTQKFEDEKNRYESLLKEDREKFKRKEEDLNKFIEDLKQRHKDELKSSEDKYKSQINSLIEDNKKLKSEIEKEVANEKERMKVLHKSDLENQENIFKRNLENQKKFYDEQNETLKKQLQQQIEFNKLANKVEISSKQIDEILQKFHQDKDRNSESEKINLENRERQLNEKEEKIKENEKIIALEKEDLLKMRGDLEMRGLEKRRELQEEKMRIEKEILRLQELQNSLKILEFNSKEKYEREKMELNQKHSEMKIDVDTLKNDFNMRLNDLEFSKKIFEEEKKFFEKYKDEAIKNIELKKSSLEDRKKQFYEEEREIKSRIKILQEKEFYLKERFEEFERIKLEIDESEKKIDKDRRELMVAAKRIEDGIKTLEERNMIIEKEREEVVKKYQELENDKAFLNSEKLKIEQGRAELRVRLQSVDMLRIKYVTNNMGNQVLPVNEFKVHNYESPFQANPNVTLPSNFLLNSNKYQNNYLDGKLSNFNQTNNINNDFKQSKSFSNNSNFRKSFNADDYMQSLKFKLGESEREKNLNQNNNINNYIQQEKEYLRNSNEKFDNSLKNEYEKAAQKYLNKINYNPCNLSVNMDNNNYLEENDNLKPKNNYLNNEIIKSKNPDNKDFTESFNNIHSNSNTKQNNLNSSQFKEKSSQKPVINNKKKTTVLDDFEEIVHSDDYNQNILKKKNYDNEFE